MSQKRGWKLKLFKFFVTACVLFLFNAPSFSEIYVIDAAKNSVRHNNIGMNYFNEGYYYGAIQEFKIAISLNPKSQASAGYYDNLGRSYLVIGHPSLAEDCFINAIRLNPMNFSYRQHLAQTYRKMGKAVLNSKITYYLSVKNPLDSVTLGLLYIEKGDREAGIIKLDEFCINNPNLILTEGVKTFLKQFEAKDINL